MPLVLDNFINKLYILKIISVYTYWLYLLNSIPVCSYCLHLLYVYTDKTYNASINLQNLTLFNHFLLDVFSTVVTTDFSHEYD